MSPTLRLLVNIQPVPFVRHDVEQERLYIHTAATKAVRSAFGNTECARNLHATVLVACNECLDDCRIFIRDVDVRELPEIVEHHL